eukprot:9481944-Pyramimonas_sp.AAC.1
MHRLHPLIYQRGGVLNSGPRESPNNHLLRRSWGALGALLGALGAVLGLSWASLGALLGYLGATLRHLKT